MRTLAIVVIAATCVTSNHVRADLTSEAILSNWSETASPLQEFPSNNPQIAWTLENDGIVTTNGSGSLISNTTFDADFSFTTTVQPVPTEFPDNDLWGVAFGWQDLSNHYRLGWGGGGNRDTGLGGTDVDGLYLVKEIDGVGSVLFNDASLHWENDTAYHVTVSRSSSDVSFSVTRVLDSVLLGTSTVTDTTFQNGRLGIWVESQSTRFSDFSINQPDPNLLFFDDFEDEPEPVDPRGFTENYTGFQKWDVVGSGVDLFAQQFFPEQGITVDLDGTSGSTLITKDAFDLSAGTYELQFDLGGPLGGIPTDTVVIAIGDVFTESITIDRGSEFQTYTQHIEVSSPVTERISFSDLGADSNGAFLDNVRLTRITQTLPLKGDYDGDELLTVDDLNQLTDAIHDGASENQYDLNENGAVDTFDRIYWIQTLKGTDFGDANLDGQFDSTDLIEVFQAGEFADSIPGNSTWSDGDFGGDFEFDTDDLVLAFQTGTYENGPNAVAVPEPSFLLHVALPLFGWVRRRIRQT